MCCKKKCESPYVARNSVRVYVLQEMCASPCASRNSVESCVSVHVLQEIVGESMCCKKQCIESMHYKRKC